VGELRIVKLERRPDIRPTAERANVARDLFARLMTRRTAPAWAFVDSMGVIERRTFAEVARGTARWSWLLRSSGARPGERVVVLASRRPEWLAVVLGTINGGSVAVPYPGDSSVDEIDALVQDSGAVLVVADDDADPALDAVSGAAVLRHGEAEALLSEQPTRAPTFDTGAGDVALLVYGRDPSGSLRGAAHTHASCLAQVDTGGDWLEATPGGRLWCSAEPGAQESIWAMLAAWGHGTELIVHEGVPSPADAVGVIDRLRIQLLWLSHAEYGRLTAVERPDWLPRPRILTAVVTDEPPDTVSSDSFARAFGPPLRYGLLRPETGIFGGELTDGERRTGFLGRVLPGREAAVLDHRGRPAPPGSAGELAIQAGSLGAFVGWWSQRSGTPVRPRDGWIPLGETAVLDEDGFLRPANQEEIERVSAARATTAEDERRAAAEKEARQRAEADERRRREEASERERQAEKQRREAEKAERARLKAEEQARKADERRLAEQRKREELERARLEREQAKAAERARAEEDERRAAAEAARAEQARLATERQAREEAERRLAEGRRLEAERAEQRAREGAERRLAEKRRLQAERAEQARLAAEQQAREEAERRLAEERRVQAERAQQAGLAAEEQARREAERRRDEELRLAAERHRLEAERAEQARLAAEERARQDALRRAEEEQRRRRDAEEQARREEAEADAERQKRAATPDGEESNPSLVARIEAYTASPSRRPPSGDGDPAA
jgi:acyl-coenzyme A synthetase/AMP-(fatty) acid ligase